jgi:hypothetical protein
MASKTSKSSKTSKAPKAPKMGARQFARAETVSSKDLKSLVFKRNGLLNEWGLATRMPKGWCFQDAVQTSKSQVVVFVSGKTGFGIIGIKIRKGKFSTQTDVLRFELPYDNAGVARALIRFSEGDYTLPASARHREAQQIPLESGSTKKSGLAKRSVGVRNGKVGDGGDSLQSATVANVMRISFASRFPPAPVGKSAGVEDSAVGSHDELVDVAGRGPGFPSSNEWEYKRFRFPTQDYNEDT